MSDAADPYIWLENLNDPRVLDFIKVKNASTREFLKDCSDKLRSRVLKYYSTPRILMTKLTKRGIYILIAEKLENRVYLLHNDGSRELIITNRDLGENIVIKWIDANEYGDRLAVAYSRGSDTGYVKIIDPFNKEEIDKLYGSVGDFIWISRDRYYYTRLYRDEKTPDNVNPPAERVFLREEDSEEMVWGTELGTNYLINLSKSIDSSKILITVFHGWSKSWVYGGDLEKPSSWVRIYGDSNHIYYPIDYVDNKYFILAYDSEELGRIIEVSDEGGVREVISEDKYFPLDYAVASRDRILAVYIVHGSSALRVFDFNGRLVKEYKPDPPGTINTASLECIDDTCIFKYESSFIPYRLYTYRNDEISIIDKIEFSNDNFSIDEFWVESYDKTPIHVFRIYNRSCDNKKTILYGYGGFGVNIAPVYSPYLLLFIEDCGSICLANIRGGGEYGERWHKAGKRVFKENVFQDFISIAKYLKNNGYDIVVMGSSNGGLLTAVTMIRIPEILKGVLIGYPLIDMLRFHKLYIGKLWVDEYGDPDDPADREYLLKYSPYHNLKPGVKYPLALIYTGLHDDRVHPGHALKFSAKLDELGVEHYLRVETESGHSGASPEVKLNEYLDILAFVYKVFGLKP